MWLVGFSIFTIFFNECRLLTSLVGLWQQCYVSVCVEQERALELGEPLLYISHLLDPALLCVAERNRPFR